MRLRTGDTLTRNRDIFQVCDKTQAKYLRFVREAMLDDFVPVNLGFEYFDRQKIIENTSQMARMLYGEDKAIIVADATYIYYNKSGNFKLQRITYNDQKKGIS